MKLLIVDDEQIIQRGLLHLDWAKAGITQTQCADNGTDALALLHTFQPDVLLADIQMPGLTGLDLARTVKEQQLSCRLILLSGYGTFEYAREAIKYNVFEYLLKPSSPEEILECVGRAVQERNRELSRQTVESMQSRQDQIFSADKETVSDILQYIEQNYMFDITLTTLSEQMHFSPAYLSRLIKKETGYNFIRLLTMMRMLKAAQLLSSTNLKVYAICERVGIADQRYFSQLFRRTFGHSPMEYQKLNKDRQYESLADFLSKDVRT